MRCCFWRKSQHKSALGALEDGKFYKHRMHNGLVAEEKFIYDSPAALTVRVTALSDTDSEERNSLIWRNPNMPKYYIESGNVSFVVCANDAQGAALWAMHRTIDDKICEYEDELSLRSHLIEDAMAYEESIDGVPENVPFEPMLEGLAEFDETIKVSELGFGRDDGGCLETDEVFNQWRQLMAAVDRLFDKRDVT